MLYFFPILYFPGCKKAVDRSVGFRDVKKHVVHGRKYNTIRSPWLSKNSKNRNLKKKNFEIEKISRNLKIQKRIWYQSDHFSTSKSWFWFQLTSPWVRKDSARRYEALLWGFSSPPDRGRLMYIYILDNRHPMEMRTLKVRIRPFGTNFYLPMEMRVEPKITIWRSKSGLIDSRFFYLDFQSFWYFFDFEIFFFWDFDFWNFYLPREMRVEAPTQNR